jgi:ABC-type glycerol-3-phosphate transport system substrate-binding protein
MGGLGNSDLFLNGTAAMFQSGTWQSPNFRVIKDFDWDVVEFPKGPHGHRGFAMSASGYAILKGCKHPDLAYELVKYFGGEMGQKYLASTGLTQPALRPLAQSKAFLDGQKPLSKGFLVDAVKYGHFQPFDPNETEWITMVGSALDRVWNGTATPAEVLKKAAKEVNAKFFSKH